MPAPTGSQLISARELHSKGVSYVLSQIPEAEAYYITFDIDGYDMTLAPGAASPLPGGITYDESMDFIKRNLRDRKSCGDGPGGGSSSV